MEEKGGDSRERQTGGVLLPSSVRTGGNKSPLSISLLTALYWAHSPSRGQRAVRQKPTSCGQDPHLTPIYLQAEN